MEGINAIDVNGELEYCVNTLHAITDSETDPDKVMNAIDMIKDLILLQSSLNAKAYELQHPLRMFMPAGTEEEE